MKPKIEFDQPPQAYSQVVSRNHAADMRDIMGTVVQEGGTASDLTRQLAGLGIRIGGKTGTADKDGTPLYNKDGTRKMRPGRKRTRTANGST